VSSSRTRAGVLVQISLTCRTMLHSRLSDFTFLHWIKPFMPQQYHGVTCNFEAEVFHSFSEFKRQEICLLDGRFTPGVRDMAICSV